MIDYLVMLYRSVKRSGGRDKFLLFVLFLHVFSLIFAILLFQHLAALAVAADQTATAHQPSLPPLTRENFSFSSRVIVGDFLQPTAGEQTVRLSDSDVAKRLEELVMMRGQTGSQQTNAQLREHKLLQLKQDKEAKIKAREDAAKQKEQLR